MAGLIVELRRRNVFKVGIAYLVAAWLLMQITDVVAPLLSLPSSPCSPRGLDTCCFFFCTPLRSCVRNVSLDVSGCAWPLRGLVLAAAA